MSKLSKNVQNRSILIFFWKNSIQKTLSATNTQSVIQFASVFYCNAKSASFSVAASKIKIQETFKWSIIPDLQKCFVKILLKTFLTHILSE